MAIRAQAIEFWTFLVVETNHLSRWRSHPRFNWLVDLTDTCVMPQDYPIWWTVWPITRAGWVLQGTSPPKADFERLPTYVHAQTAASLRTPHPLRKRELAYFEGVSNQARVLSRYIRGQKMRLSIIGASCFNLRTITVMESSWVILITQSIGIHCAFLRKLISDREAPSQTPTADSKFYSFGDLLGRENGRVVSTMLPQRIPLSRSGQHASSLHSFVPYEKTQSRPASFFIGRKPPVPNETHDESSASQPRRDCEGIFDLNLKSVINWVFLYCSRSINWNHTNGSNSKKA